MQSDCWGFMVPVPMWASCCAGNTRCPGSSSAFFQSELSSTRQYLEAIWQALGEADVILSLFPTLFSCCNPAKNYIYQNWEPCADLTGSLNKTPCAAQWRLNFCYIVVAGIILSFSFVSLLSLPLFLLKKIHGVIRLQMNGQRSDNRSELELKSTGIITVINSSSRGTASVGSIAGSCRGREMGEEEWPAAEIVCPRGPHSPLECIEEKSSCALSLWPVHLGCRDPHLPR